MSIVNSTNNPLNSQNYYLGLYEDVKNNMSVSVSLLSDTDNTITLYHSNDRVSIHHQEEYNTLADISFLKQVLLRCKYFKIKVENTTQTNQTKLSVLTRFLTSTPDNINVSLSADDNDSVLIKLYNDNNQLTNLRCDNSGNLKITGLSGSTIDTSNLATETTLRDISKNLITLTDKFKNDGNNNLYVRVSDPVEILEPTPVKYITTQTSLNNSSVLADTSCSYSYDDYGRDGWYFQNKSANTKFNLYYYDGLTSTNMTKSQVSAWSVVNILGTSKPFITIYSKPTGINDYAVWYHSAWVFTFPIGAEITTGEDILIYTGSDPSSIHTNLRHIQLTNTTTNGQGLSTENILTLTLHSDSSASVNTMKILVNSLGFSTASKNVELKLRTQEQKDTKDFYENVRITNNKLQVEDTQLTTLSSLSTETTLQSTNTKLDNLTTAVQNLETQQTYLSIVSNYTALPNVYFGETSLSQNKKQHSIYMSTDTDCNILIYLSPDGINWFYYQSLSAKSNETNLITLTPVARKIKFIHTDIHTINSLNLILSSV